MQKPLQINFRHMGPSEAVETRIREEVNKLETFYHKMIGCTVTFETPHPRHQHGKLYLVRIHLTVPGSADGIEVCFHRNRVLDEEFDKLETGSTVRFAEEQGTEGPQASTVELL